MLLRQRALTEAYWAHQEAQRVYLADCRGTVTSHGRSDRQACAGDDGAVRVLEPDLGDRRESSSDAVRAPADDVTDCRSVVVSVPVVLCHEDSLAPGHDSGGWPGVGESPLASAGTAIGVISEHVTADRRLGHDARAAKHADIAR